jgi:precorrin-2/cobalt-factor-2 C20-methyltransferase
LYKPSALKERLREVVESAGPWAEMLRVDRAGLPDERIIEGLPALRAADEYLSILLLKKNAQNS